MTSQSVETIMLSWMPDWLEVDNELNSWILFATTVCEICLKHTSRFSWWGSAPLAPLDGPPLDLHVKTFKIIFIYDTRMANRTIPPGINYLKMVFTQLY